MHRLATSVRLEAARSESGIRRATQAVERSEVPSACRSGAPDILYPTTDTFTSGEAEWNISLTVGSF